MTDGELRRHIGQEVKVAMLRKRVVQRTLAAEIGISVATLNGRITGKTDFGTTELYRIAQVLDVDVTEFYPDADSAIAN
jgi:transcriptional regulator with XRE-family HTH domain